MKFAAITDIHVGASGYPPGKVLERLGNTLFPQLPHCKILFIGGDFFDTLLHLDGPQGIFATLIVRDLIDASIQHGFYIRVVRGTFSHDRRQPLLFAKSVPRGFEMLDGVERVRVFEDVTIESLPNLGLNALYIPDNLSYKNVYEVIEQRLQDRGLETVHVCVSHGYWTHLLGNVPITPPNTLDWEIMKKYVTGVCINGHVHTPGVYMKVVNCGSFDRLNHGEEEPKGFFMIHLNEEANTYTFEFIENKDATLFKTIDLTSATSSHEALELFKTKFTALETKTSEEPTLHLRIVCDDKSIRIALDDMVKSLRPRTTYVSHQGHTKLIQDPNLINMDLTELPEITPENLPGMIAEYIQNHYHVSLSIEDIKTQITAA